MYFPLFIKTDELPCLIIGGGDVAARKIEMLSNAGCRIHLIAPRINEKVMKQLEQEKFDWFEREYDAGDCEDYQLVIAATENKPVNLEIYKDATGFGIPVNVVDEPDLCTVIFPAIYSDKPLTVAVSTSGVAPFLAAEIRTRIAGQAGGFGRWVEIGGRFRELVRCEVKDSAAKKQMYKKFIDAGPPDRNAQPPDTGKLADWVNWLDSIIEGNRDR